MHRQYLLHITWWRPQFLENLPGLVMMTVLDQPARRLRAEPESYKEYETRHRCQTKVIFPAVGVISKESIHQRCSYLRWKSVLIKTIHIIKISNASKLALLLLLLLFWTLSSPPVRNFVESVRMDSGQYNRCVLWWKLTWPNVIITWNDAPRKPLMSSGLVSAM